MNLLMPLKIGDTIGIIAPSMPHAVWFPGRFNYALKSISLELGSFELAEHVLTDSGFTSGTSEQVANDINKFIANPKIKAIFSSIGGYNSARVLPYIDWDLARENPKVMIGYSDITSLLLGFQALGEWATFYGPNVMTQFGEYPRPLDYTLHFIKRALYSNKKLGEFRDPDYWTDEILDWKTTAWQNSRRLFRPANREAWKYGSGDGILYGGNIDTLNFIIGTEYFSPPKQVVFFWETSDALSVAEIHRALTQLKQCGFFNKVSGMLIGRFPTKRINDISIIREVVLSLLKEFSFPIVAQLPFGHTDPMITLPIGAKTSVIASESSSIVNVD